MEEQKYKMDKWIIISLTIVIISVIANIFGFVSHSLRWVYVQLVLAFLALVFAGRGLKSSRRIAMTLIILSIITILWSIYLIVANYIFLSLF